MANRRAEGDGAAPLPRGAAWREVQRWRGGIVDARRDALAEEVPVALRCNGEVFAVMLATPLDLHDFARGFALTEALVDKPEQLLAVAVSEQVDGFAIDLTLPADLAGRALSRSRLLEGRSGCGVCGSRAPDLFDRLPPPLHSGFGLSAATLQRALAALPALQPINRATGATHAAAWCDGDGGIVCVREDVGRHNALDKLVGALLDAPHLPLQQQGFVLLTSRASVEMVLKSARAGIAVVAAVSAPTALAVAAADSGGLTLIGFARGGDCAVYSHARRFLPP